MPLCSTHKDIDCAMRIAWRGWRWTLWVGHHSQEDFGCWFKDVLEYYKNCHSYQQASGLKIKWVL